MHFLYFFGNEATKITRMRQFLGFAFLWFSLFLGGQLLPLAGICQESDFATRWQRNNAEYKPGLTARFAVGVAIGLDGKGERYRLGDTLGTAGGPFHGPGLNLTLGLGWMFNKYHGLEIGWNYVLIGEKSLRDEFLSSANTKLIQNSAANGSYHALHPAYVLMLGRGEIGNFFARVGCPIAWPQVDETIEKEEFRRFGSRWDEIYKVELQQEYTGGLAFGYSMALGAQLNVRNFGVGLEAGLTGFAWKPTQLEIREYKSRGNVGSPPFLETFHPALPENHTNTQNLQFSFPMNHIYINFLLSYGF